MRLHLHCCLVVAVTVLSVSAVAQTPVRDHDIQPEDYFSLAFISSLAISPGGSKIAWTEMRWEEENDARNTDLWVVDVATKAVTRLTFDPATDAAPAWSPDERWIYFGSARGEDEKPPHNGKRQVWRVSPEGGDIHAVTRLEKGIKDFELSADGGTLYYTIGDEQVEEDRWKSLRKKFDGVTYGHGVVEKSQLWALDLSSWRSEKLVDESRVIGAFAVSPDETRIAMITTPTEELITNEGWSEIDVLERATGAITRVPDRLWCEDAPSPYGWLLTPTWSTDGTALAHGVGFDGYPAEIFVTRFDGEEPRVFAIERPDEVALEGDMRWRPGSGDLCFIAEQDSRARVHCLRDAASGAWSRAEVLTPGDVVVDRMSFTRGGDRLAVVRSDPANPADIHVGAIAGTSPRFDRITRINPQVDTWKLPQIEIVRWTSADGTEVQGILELPPGYVRGDGPLPMVVHLHGGPTSSTKYMFQFWIYGRTIFASRGWALLSPNYRGSTGFGDAFLEQLIGNKNVLDVQDILSGVDAMVDRGVADPERLAVMGWSNGGYLTNCLIARTDRFKAASSGAGVFDTVMQWSIEDTPGHVINYSQGLPWTNPRRMHASSPLYDVDKVRTPTVVHVGEHDPRVPVEHSKSLHRALHHYLNVPCELVVYPGAGHGLTKLSHRKAKLTWDLEWFDYWVLGKSSDDD